MTQQQQQQSRMIRKTLVLIAFLFFSTNVLWAESFAPPTARTYFVVATTAGGSNHWVFENPSVTPLHAFRKGRNFQRTCHLFRFRAKNTVESFRRRAKRFLSGLMVAGALLILGWKPLPVHASMTRPKVERQQRKEQPLLSPTDEAVESTKLSTAKEILVWAVASGGTFVLSRKRNQKNDDPDGEEETTLETLKVERAKKLELQKECIDQGSLSLQKNEPKKPSSSLEDIQALETNTTDDSLEDDDEEFTARNQALSSSAPSGPEARPDEEALNQPIKIDEAGTSKQDKNGMKTKSSSEDIPSVDPNSPDNDVPQEKTNEGDETLEAGIFENKEVVQKELERVMSITKEWDFLQEPATNTGFPLRNKEFIAARRQPKSIQEQEQLALKYGRIGDVSERAFQVLKDLGMVEESKPVEMEKFEGIIDMQKRSNEE